MQRLQRLRYVRRCALRRTESANPAGVILIKCCLWRRRMTCTRLPSASLSCQGMIPVPPFNRPTIHRTNWDGFPVAHRRQYFHQIIVNSSSSIFWRKTDNTRRCRCRHSRLRVSICKRQLISTYVCVFNNSSSTWNPIQIIAHVNYTYFALYQTPRPQNSTHLSRGKKLDFFLTRTYYFLVTLFLFFPAFSC